MTHNRSADDELLLKLLGNPNYIGDIGDKPEITVHIYDARPYLNAMANKVNGKGFEDVKFYKNCEIFFMDIENIHHVRDCHKKLISMCYNNDKDNSKWLSNLENSGWLQVISYILNASVSVVNSMLVI